MRNRFLTQLTLLTIVVLLSSGCLSSSSPIASGPTGPEAVQTVEPPAQQTVADPSPTADPKEPAPRKIGPGLLVGAGGEQLGDGGQLEFTVLQTPEGNITIGIWPALHPQFFAHLQSTPEFYSGATILTNDENFVRVVPAKLFVESKLAAGAPVVEPSPGLAFANSKGEILISLSEAKPPEGFLAIGQATVDLNAVDVWKTVKEGRKVESAGGLRT